MDLRLCGKTAGALCNLLRLKPEEVGIGQIVLVIRAQDDTSDTSGICIRWCLVMLMLVVHPCCVRRSSITY